MRTAERKNKTTIPLILGQTHPETGPEARRYSTVNNVVFYESFKHRIDALRHHDKRRDLLNQGVAQPVKIDDFDDDNAQGVRNLYSDPDPVPPRLIENAELEDVVNANADGGVENNADVLLEDGQQVEAPVSPQIINAERARGILRSAEVLRPLRLLPVGREARWTKDDADFVKHAFDNDIPSAFVPNPKRRSTTSFRRYLKYSPATTLREALELGASMDDIRWDYRRGFIRFPKHESDLPGHVYSAIQTAEEYGHTHVLDDVACCVTPSEYADHMISRAFASAGLERAKVIFNDDGKSAYDPTELPKMIATQEAALKFAELQFAKVMNAKKSKPGVNIDFSLAPEPVRWEETLPEVCSESERWREAMDDEIVTMTKFGVYKKLPKSAAGNRQILGCRWVYKRKTNKNGEVVRYRARLVAQGYRQREYDSFDPNSIFSPVVHKDTLRMFSVYLCCRELEDIPS